MARVVAVHGIGKQTLGAETLRRQWLPALNDGLTRADRAGRLPESDVAVAFYGDLFRPDGEFLAAGDPPYTAADVAEGFEQDLLLAWWKAAAESDPAVVPPDAADTLVATPRSVQAALRALSGSRFFAGLALRAMVFDLKQVHHYLTDPNLRAKALARVIDHISDDTRVVIAHSLGSVIAYEALCARPGHPVLALVTIGSPLGIENLILHRLQPAPLTLGGQAQGVWPGGEQLAWTNLADQGDVVALVKDLRPVFGERVRCAVVYNGAHAHDAAAYLTDKLCGQAIAGGLV
ncbi:lipase family protein [Streptomyces cellulosae]|uniref:Mucin n=1 Tax=Streptomyces cellulosae TaxID=1968 RepID=A0ABW7YHQ7_STRCE